jgi:hypothetical protein
MAFDFFHENLLFATCFAEIESLHINDVVFFTEAQDFALDLLASKLVLESTKFRRLEMANCGLELSTIFNATRTCHITIPILDFTGNEFMENPADDLLIGLNPRSRLILENCEFGEGVFPKFLEMLSHHQGQSLRLNCRALKMAKGMLFGPSVCLRTLTHLIWDGNLINRLGAKEFFEFLIRCPKLSSLSINDCITMYEFPFVAPEMSAYLGECSLLEFKIGATRSETVLGPGIVPIIEVLMRLEKIKMLDLSGQSIGENGLELIFEKLPRSMDALMFDGSAISSGEALVRILQSLSALLREANDIRLKQASWPQRDLKTALLGTPVEDRSVILTEIEGIRQEIECCGSILGDIASRRPESNPVEYFSRGDEGGNGKILAFDGVTRSAILDENPFRMNDGIEGVLDECGLGDKVDPMVGMAVKLREEYGFPHLLEVLRKREDG